MLQRRHAAFLLGPVLACGTSSSDQAGGESDSFYCRPEQSMPYADGIPYLGVHADAGNSDVVACQSADNFDQRWHALTGMGLAQPNTFSPDGQVTYATTTHPDPEGCRLWALDTATGDVRWCQSFPPSIGQGAVEVDEAGHLYFTVGDTMVSLTADGDSRWSTSFSTGGEMDAPWGLHFTPDGHIATVTTGGVVHLVDRVDGTSLSSLSIAEEWGFVAPESLDISGELDLLSLLPQAVQDNVVEVWGEGGEGDESFSLAGFLGAGGFVDNTLGVDASGRLYIIGGGPDEAHGALVQVRVGGTPQAPTLKAGWAATTIGGSATSPSISADGRFVVIGDGSTTAAILSSSASDARVRVADIHACDENTDTDPDPGLCAFAFEEALERGPLPGSPAILPDGTVIFYEFSLDFAFGPARRDMVALGPDGVLWELALPGDLDWNSVITVTDTHIIGTASRVTLSEESLLGLHFPVQTEDYLVLLDREDGHLVRTIPIADDSSATVTIGPDGALYVGVYGLLSVLSIEDRPELGLVRLDPVAD